MLVNNAINPFNEKSYTRLSESLYSSYIKLQNLSMRARYLCHDNPKNQDKSAFFTYDKHFARSIRHLDRLVHFMHDEYKVEFDIVEIDCTDLKNEKLEYFQT